MAKQGKGKERAWAKRVDEEGREYLIDKNSGEIKGTGFGMVDRSILPDIQKLIKKHSSAAEVLYFLASMANKSNEVCLAQNDIEKKSGFSRSKIQRGISVLGKTGFIKVELSGGSNKYYINDRFIWRSSFAEKQYKSSHTGKIIF